MPPDIGPYAGKRMKLRSSSRPHTCQRRAIARHTAAGGAVGSRMKVRLLVPLMAAALAVGLALPSPAAADTTVFKARFLCNDRGAITPAASFRGLTSESLGQTVCCRTARLRSHATADGGAGHQTNDVDVRAITSAASFY
jgi:hypothetical protein